jgi:hypothetical protein
MWWDTARTTFREWLDADPANFLLAVGLSGLVLLTVAMGLAHVHPWLVVFAAIVIPLWALARRVRR